MKILILFLSLLLTLNVAAQVVLKDINPGPDSSEAGGFIDYNGATYFIADDGVHGFELWKTDGTAAGTELVKDICPGPCQSMSSLEFGSYGRRLYPPFYILNNKMVFVAFDTAYHDEYWVSDGTEAGTVRLTDIDQNNYAGVTDGVLFNGSIYFAGGDTSGNFELWKTDGTLAGTQLVKDIWPGTGGSGFPMGFTVLNNELYFWADDSIHGQEIWKTDGTTAGTMMIGDVTPGTEGTGVSYPTVAGNKLFFTDYSNTYGAELWVTDGTSGGTYLVKDIFPGGNGGHPDYLIELNGKLIFDATNAPNDHDLWISDGTDAGTVKLKDINVNYSSDPMMFTRLGNKVFFTANDGPHGPELWVTDGTEAGTMLFKDLNPNDTLSWNILSMEVTGGKLYVSLYNEIDGTDLWVTDGTQAGTLPIDFCASCDGRAVNFFAAGDKLFFLGNDAIVGQELFTIDVEPTGIKEAVEVDGDISIYPNPVNNLLTVKSLSAPLSYAGIYNMQGRVLQQQNVEGMQVNFDMSKEPAGLYMVKITDAKGNVQVVKMLKQ